MSGTALLKISITKIVTHRHEIKLWCVANLIIYVCKYIAEIGLDISKFQIKDMVGNNGDSELTFNEYRNVMNYYKTFYLAWCRTSPNCHLKF